MNYQGTKEINTKRLFLRKFQMKDAADMFNNWASDNEVTRYLLWNTHKDIKETKAVIKLWTKNYQDELYFNWAIVLKSINQPIGSIGLVEIDLEKKCCEVGYCISKKYWNQGITSEALKAILDFLLNKNDFEQVVAKHQKENLYSGKVMEKCGMHYLSTRKLFLENKNKTIEVSAYYIKK